MDQPRYSATRRASGRETFRTVRAEMERVGVTSSPRSDARRRIGSLRREGSLIRGLDWL